jgi:phage-related protein
MPASYKKLTVKFFITEAGNEPVKDFLMGLAPDDRKIVGTDIKTVEFGWPLGMPLVRKMDSDLWEVRSSINNGIVRVLFTTQGSQMILLHGFIKKSDKTPLKELKTANDRKKLI